MGEGVNVAVSEGVRVGVSLGVCVGVADGVKVAEAVSVAVGVRVNVGVKVAVEVSVGVGVSVARVGTNAPRKMGAGVGDASQAARNTITGNKTANIQQRIRRDIRGAAP